MSNYTYTQLEKTDKVNILKSKIKNYEYRIFDLSFSIDIEKTSTEINSSYVDELQSQLDGELAKIEFINDLVLSIESEVE
jgi:hypothetical protein